MKNKLFKGILLAVAAVVVGLVGSAVFKVSAFNGPTSGAGVGGGAISVNASSSVGIGTTTPGFKLDVQGGQINSSGGYCINGANCIAVWPSGGSSQWTTGGGGIYYNGLVGIATTTASYKLDVGSGAATTARFGTVASDTVVIGGGAGKLNVGTVDPPYTIDGAKYATYNSGMTGVKEETAGTLALQKGIDGKYGYTLDLENQPIGSDLWLFGKVTDITDHFDALVVSLTSGFDGTVWYEKVPASNILIIHATVADNAATTLEVSYRLTAPRFDAANWQNTRTGANEPDGIIIK